MITIVTILNMNSLSNVPPSLLSKISSFITTASHYWNDILLAQSSKHSADSAPVFLPPSISTLLSINCDLTTDDILILWEYLQHEIWVYEEREISKKKELRAKGINEAYGTPFDQVLYILQWLHHNSHFKIHYIHSAHDWTLTVNRCQIIGGISRPI